MVHMLYVMMMTSHCTKHRWYIQHILQSLTSHEDLYKYRLYGESMEIRDLETRGPWAVAFERSEDATKGPRVSKSRISIGRAV